MKGQVFVQEEIITKMQIWVEITENVFFSRTAEPKYLRFT
jgi:hypothetical protein